MALNATDISLIFLGILIVLVLLEVRKLRRKPEPVSRLEEQFDRLSRQMERIGIAPEDMELPGGAQIVEAGRSFETITEQLERLGQSTADLDAEIIGHDGMHRFLDNVGSLQEELRGARGRLDQGANELRALTESIAAAEAALRRIEHRLDRILLPSDPGPDDDSR